MIQILTQAEAATILAMAIAANSIGGEFDIRIPDATMPTRISYSQGRRVAFVIEQGVNEEKHASEAAFVDYYGLES